MITSQDGNKTLHLFDKKGVYYVTKSPAGRPSRAQLPKILLIKDRIFTGRALMGYLHFGLRSVLNFCKFTGHREIDLGSFSL